MWWENAVVYQVYPRSFQDTDGDGIGDLPGIERRIDHLLDLGASALWLSPIYPSPLADFGYDVSDHAAVDPAYGTLEHFDSLLAAVHARGLRLLMDLVPCHTSIEHPWFREHPEFYVWADGERPPNNWRSVFGGPAWSRDAVSGRWYLHSFYPEQPDLDWRNPELVAAMQGVVRFWLDRGVDGFRLDAIERLVKDPELRDDPPATEPFALPEGDEYAQLEHRYSKNAPGVQDALAAIREAAGDALLVGEVYLPSNGLSPFLEHVDVAFAFELLDAPLDSDRLRAVIAGATSLGVRPGGGVTWVLSNHDCPRLATRFGPEGVRVAAMLLLTLPGPAFVYQGDEIGMSDGTGADPPSDRFGRDGARHPMQWDETTTGGFSSGSPWLPSVDPAERNVAAQRGDAGSLLNLYRELIALRSALRGGLELIDAPAGVLAYRRGEHMVTLNLAPEARDVPAAGEIVLATHSRTGGLLAPRAGEIRRRR